MRIVDAKTFLDMPSGVLFQRYDPEVISCTTELCIKGDTIGDKDFAYLPLQDNYVNATDTGSFIDCHANMNRGHDEPLAFDNWSRDGLFNMDQKYAVWNPGDVFGLIKTLVAIDMPMSRLLAMLTDK